MRTQELLRDYGARPKRRVWIAALTEQPPALESELAVLFGMAESVSPADLKRRPEAAVLITKARCLTALLSRLCWTAKAFVLPAQAEWLPVLQARSTTHARDAAWCLLLWRLLL